MSMIHWLFTLLKAKSVDIVSDWDPKSMSKFWWTLWKHMGLEFKMNTTFQPQMDGQTERVNLVIQQFLKNYVVVDQQDWVDHLGLDEFYYKNSEHSTTNSTISKWWRASHQLCPQLGLHLGNPQMMQMRKCQWSHNLMKKGGACGKWLRPVLKKRINNTKTFRTSLDKRWIFKKKWNVVEHQEFLVAWRFEPQFLGPICGSIQSVGKKDSQHLQIKTIGKS